LLSNVHQADLDNNSYNICVLIPSIVDYFFPNEKYYYIGTGEKREFTNLILFAPDSL